MSLSGETVCPVCGAALEIVAAVKPETPSDADLLWVGYPFSAQVDVANPKAGLESIAGTISESGPYRSINVLNNGYGYAVNDFGELRLEVHPGDKPPGASGGFRAALLINDAIQPYVDIIGNGDGLERYLRHEFAIDSPVSSVNNLGELHGNVDGSSPFCFAPNGAGDRIGLKFFAPDGSGTHWYDEQKLVDIVGELQIYALNYRLSVDRTIGYFRLYRWIDGRWDCRTLHADGADDEGRIFTQTQQLTSDGTVVKMAWSVELYCSQQLTSARVAYFGAGCRIGRTLQSISDGLSSTFGPAGQDAMRDDAERHRYWGD